MKIPRTYQYHTLGESPLLVNALAPILYFEGALYSKPKSERRKLMLINGNAPWAGQWASVNTVNKTSTGAESFSIAAGSSGKHLGNLQISALVAAGIRLPNGGWMSANVFKSDNFTDENPVMLVKGIDVCGTPFEVEVNINDVNPRNASFVEMFALDGYFTLQGKPAGVTRAAVGGMIQQELNGGNFDGFNAFSKMDFVAAVQQHMETQRSNGNWEGYFWLRPIFDTLSNHIESR